MRKISARWIWSQRCPGAGALRDYPCVQGKHLCIIKVFVVAQQLCSPVRHQHAQDHRSGIVMSCLASMTDMLHILTYIHLSTVTHVLCYRWCRCHCRLLTRRVDASRKVVELSPVHTACNLLWRSSQIKSQMNHQEGLCTLILQNVTF